MGRAMDPTYGGGVFAADLRQLRHYFYGSTPAAIERLTATLPRAFGELNLVGAYSPPIRPAWFEEDEEVLSRIRQLQPIYLGWTIHAKAGTLAANPYAENRKWRRDRCRRGFRSGFRVRRDRRLAGYNDQVWNGCSGWRWSREGSSGDIIFMVPQISILHGRNVCYTTKVTALTRIP